MRHAGSQGGIWTMPQMADRSNINMYTKITKLMVNITIRFIIHKNYHHYCSCSCLHRHTEAGNQHEEKQNWPPPLSYDVSFQ